MATNFQRARSDEQRAQRREAILETAAAMLTEMPVARVSLNELSRRVGLAKSNVLRYFESREAVLLDLLDAAEREWLDQLDAELSAQLDARLGAGSAVVTGPGSDPVVARPGAGSAVVTGPGKDPAVAGPGADPYERGDAVVAVLAASLAARPVLCDLVSAQAAVLERNVSAQVAAQYKRAAVANVVRLAELVAARIPELGEADGLRFAAAALMTTGAVWTHAQPSAAMLAAYEADPSLAALRLDFPEVLRETLEVILSGLLARRLR
jgi:AcrR family transcriptional regulator